MRIYARKMTFVYFTLNVALKFTEIIHRNLSYIVTNFHRLIIRVRNNNVIIIRAKIMLNDMFATHITNAEFEVQTN